ncbi:hypothetical protein M231_07152 [Tremella mesenterica]|uniref:Uncharacterized protein n=1 Tax=Tremella mesenterica TaxID=5217 RepID=A0A4Q1B9V0_TREME|nr:hypothetical protein M231_07152 [Tremella mesenterica]
MSEDNKDGNTTSSVSPLASDTSDNPSEVSSGSKTSLTDIDPDGASHVASVAGTDPSPPHQSQEALILSDTAQDGSETSTGNSTLRHLWARVKDGGKAASVQAAHATEKLLTDAFTSMGGGFGAELPPANHKEQVAGNNEDISATDSSSQSPHSEPHLSEISRPG